MEVGKIAHFLVEVGEKAEGIGWLCLGVGVLLFLYDGKGKKFSILWMILYFSSVDTVLAEQPVQIQWITTSDFIQERIDTGIRITSTPSEIYRICLKIDGQVFLEEVGEQEGVEWEKHISLPVSKEGSILLQAEVETVEGKSVSSEHVWICDRTPPKIKIQVLGEKKGEFYRTSGKVKIRVEEAYFQPELWEILWKEAPKKMKIQEWHSTEEGTHWCEIPFAEDGRYHVIVRGKDLAGNYGVGEQKETRVTCFWTVDQTAPEINVRGIEDGKHYNRTIHLEVECKEQHLDEGSSSIQLYGEEQGTCEIIEEERIEESIKTYQWKHTDEMRDDTYHLEIHWKDRAGNETKRAWKFYINQDGSHYQLRKEHKYVQVIESNRSRVLHYELLYSQNGNIRILEETKDYQRTIKESDPYVYEYRINESLFSETGDYTIYLLSEDEAGNKNSTLRTENKGVILNFQKKQKKEATDSKDRKKYNLQKREKKARIEQIFSWKIFFISCIFLHIVRKKPRKKACIKDFFML